MLKRPHYIALAIIALLTLVLLNLPERAAARLKLATSSFFLPLLGLSSSAQQVANATANAITPRRALVRENDLLREENQRLKLEAGQASGLERENARLRQMLGWQERVGWKVKSGRVILRDPANWWRTMQIGLGSRDGIRTNFAVVAMDGLVGRISAVGLTHSQVVLVGDPNCKVAALVENETRDNGVLGSTGPFDGSLVTVNFPFKEVSLKPGQRVITSGLGGIFPPGIVIGRVVDFRPIEYGLYVEARVRLSANLSSLEEVWVIFP